MFESMLRDALYLAHNKDFDSAPVDKIVASLSAIDMNKEFLYADMSDGKSLTKLASEQRPMTSPLGWILKSCKTFMNSKTAEKELKLVIPFLEYSIKNETFKVTTEEQKKTLVEIACSATLFNLDKLSGLI